jgi:hypothetical protein
MLEGSLPSTCKISDVYQFVKESLLEDVRTKAFILCKLSNSISGSHMTEILINSFILRN